MFWDVLISIGIGFSQLAVTWYAVHISIKEHRVRNAIVIGVVGLAGIVLTVFGTIRNGMVQQALENRLERIQRNTEQPPIVSVQPTPPVVIPSRKQRAYIGLEHMRVGFRGKTTLGVDVSIKNSTGIAATSEYALFRVFTVQAENPDSRNIYDAHPTRVTIDKYWADFEKFFNSTKIPDRRTLGPGESAWGSSSIEDFGDQLKSRLDSGARVILIVSSISFSDEAGPHRTDICRWLQAPFTPEQPIIHSCGVHDGIRY